MDNVVALPVPNTPPVAKALPVANQLAELIDKLNKQYAVVMVGSSLRILWEKKDPVTGKSERLFLSPNDFRTLTRNQQAGDTERSIADFFLSHRSRRQFDKIDFLPGKTPEGIYNLWTGFAVTPKAGNTEKFWRFVEEDICDSNGKAYPFVRKWLAHLFQKPAQLPGSALVLRGKQGTGKNTFVDAIGKLVGDHYLAVNSLEQITGRFNSHLGHALLVHANEATWGGNKQAEGALKAMITDSQLPLEAKGKDLATVHNYKRLIVSSNEQWAVPRGLDDRRFLILDVSDRHKEDEAHFTAIRDELEGGGYEALMHDLLHQDLAGFNPRVLPVMSAGLDMKLRSSTNTVRWLYELLKNEYRSENPIRTTEPLELPVQGGEIGKVAVYDNYSAFCTATDRTKPEAASQFWKALKQAKLALRDVRGSQGSRQRTVQFPPLADARVQFEAMVKQLGAIDWNE